MVALDGSGDFDIISAIEAVPVGEKGVIQVRAGVYDFNPNMKYPYRYISARNGMTIIGEGIDKRIIRTRAPLGDNLLHTSSRACDINNAQIFISNF